MVKIKHKEGYVGGRISKKLEVEFNKWTLDHLKSKTDILDFCIRRFLNDKKYQDDFLEKCQNSNRC